MDQFDSAKLITLSITKAISANGAAFILAWGNAPGTTHAHKPSAESAIHPKALFHLEISFGIALDMRARLPKRYADRFYGGN